MLPQIGPEEVELERDVLRLLCSGLITVSKRLEVCRVLEARLFHDPLHRVMYEEIRGAGPVDGSFLRELLPGRVTNRGFPDFSLADFSFPSTDSEEAVEALFASATRLIGGRGLDIPLR